MPLVSSVPAIQFTPAGLVLPSEADILAGVQADMNTAFGGGLNPALTTPQGQLASSETAVIADKNSQIALVVNQVDPQYADGRWQDAIGRIYFLTRKPATPTSVTVTLGGLPGTVVPVGTLAQDTNGNTYVNTGTVTIGVGSTVSAVFANVVDGPIACASGALSRVYQAVSGWDTITNPAAGVLGSNVESRAEFEFRRQASVALNAHGSPPSIYGAVFAVNDVLDAYVIDNPTGSTVNVGPTNYPVAPHSVYVAVVGGLDSDVAAAIWSKKDLGCDYNGNTTVTVTDPSGYSYPPPSYSVTFERPPGLAIKFAVHVVNSSTLPSNATALIQAAIVARFNGTDGAQRERIGATVFSSRYYSAVIAAVPTASVIDVFVGTSSPTLTQVPVGIDQQPTLNSSDITVVLV